MIQFSAQTRLLLLLLNCSSQVVADQSNRASTLNGGISFSSHSHSIQPRVSHESVSRCCIFAFEIISTSSLESFSNVLGSQFDTFLYLIVCCCLSDSRQLYSIPSSIYAPICIFQFHVPVINTVPCIVLPAPSACRAGPVDHSSSLLSRSALAA